MFSICKYSRVPKKDDETTASRESTWSDFPDTTPPSVCGRHTHYFLAKSLLPFLCSFACIVGFVWGDAHSWLLLRVGDQKSLYFSHMETLGVGGRGRGNLFTGFGKKGWVGQIFPLFPRLLRTCCEFVCFWKKEQNIHTGEIPRIGKVNPRSTKLSILQGSSSCPCLVVVL